MNQPFALQREESGRKKAWRPMATVSGIFTYMPVGAKTAPKGAASDAGHKLRAIQFKEKDQPSSNLFKSFPICDLFEKMLCDT